MLPKEAFISPLLNYLNTSTYFETQQKINLKNVQDKITLNDSLIAQIDKIIGLLSSNSSNATVSISEKNSLPQLVQKKDELIYANQSFRLKESNYDKIIKEESSVINIRKFDPLLLNPKVFLPLLLIFGYLIGYALFNAAKRRNNQ
jgi:fructose-1,6-bisphosphatase